MYLGGTNFTCLAPHHYYLLIVIEDLPNHHNNEEARIDKDGIETARTGDLRKQCAF